MFPGVLLRPGIWELLLIVAILILIFGTRRFGAVKDAFSKAISNFKHSVKDEAKD